MTTPIPAAPEQPAAEIPADVQLVIQLMGASAQSANANNWSLIQSLTVRERKARAQLALIRDALRAVADSPYAPNPAYLEALGRPSEQTVERWLAEHYSSDGESADGAWRDPTAHFTRCYRCYECQI